jgi:preprotein translocase SecE subunit
MGPNKYVHLIFAVGGLVLVFVLAKTGDWIWSLFAKPKDLVVNGAAVLIAGLVTFLAYRSEGVFAAAYDVTAELEKVAWPSRKETYAATLVVMVTVTIASIITWSFDLLWGSLANLVMR